MVPPTWYYPPLVGALIVSVLPHVVSKWWTKFVQEQMPDVFITRFIGPLIVVQRDAICELQLNEDCQSRPSSCISDLVGSLLTNKKHWVYFDGGHRDGVSDHRVHRKLSLAALYRMSRREIEAKASDTADMFLAAIEKRQGRDWEIGDELKVTKLQETLYLMIGETLDNDEMLRISPTIEKNHDYALYIILASEILPKSLLLKVCEYFPPTWNPKVLFRVYNSILQKLLARRSKPHGRTHAADFIEAVLLVRSTEETVEFLSETVIPLLIGGYHTSVSTIVVLLHLLAVHPQHQERVVEEIHSIIGSECPSIDHYDKMHFTKAVIIERLRLVPIFTHIFRKTIVRTTIAGYDVPAGMNIAAELNSRNWNRNHFEKPEMFRPERHLGANGEFVKNPQVETFSMGRRSCVGKELATITTFLYLVKILQHFEVRLADGESRELPRSTGSLSPSPPPWKFNFIRRPNAPAIRQVTLPRGLSDLIVECMREMKND